MPLEAETPSVIAAMVSHVAQPPLRTEEVYRKYHEQVARWAAKLGGPRLDVEETVQEVFTIVHQRIGHFEGTALPTWLYRITENVVHVKKRRERWRRWLGHGDREAEVDLPSLEPSALERIDHAQASALVYRVLDRLSDRHRSLLVLFELEGLSGREVAELKGLNPKTVWVALYRARSQFVKKLQEVTREIRAERHKRRRS